MLDTQIFTTNQMQNFLKEPVPRAVMIAFIEAGLPPVQGLAKLAKERIGRPLADGEKGNFGKCVRRQAEDEGFVLDRRDVPIGQPNCDFTSGSTYRRPRDDDDQKS